MLESPNLDDVKAARRRIEPYVRSTPIVESPMLSAAIGARVLVKAESLQPTGSFKVRGAFNRLARMSPEALARGVVAFSSGNHGQALACAAQRLGAPALILMPSDAPPIKIEKTRAYGAAVALYDRARDNREQLARDAAQERGATLVPPFDDPDIIAGQGSVALEALEQLGGVPIDAVLVPCSGGGLAAGCALVLESLAPRVEVLVVEPEGFEDAARSLAAGELRANAPGPKSICDSLLSAQLGQINLDILLRARAQALAVGDNHVRRAVYDAFAELKLVLEPGGAAALAAVLQFQERFAGANVLVVASGANADPGLFADVLNNPPDA